jgi:hypothetical protein
MMQKLFKTSAAFRETFTTLSHSSNRLADTNSSRTNLVFKTFRNSQHLKKQLGEILLKVQVSLVMILEFLLHV